MNARDVMTRPAYTCRLDTTLDEASRFMEENACGTLIVLDGAGQLAGILTDRDLALTIGRTESRPSDVSVVGAMTRNVHTCLPNDDLSVALGRMSDAKYAAYRSWMPAVRSRACSRSTTLSSGDSGITASKKSSW